MPRSLALPPLRLHDLLARAAKRSPAKPATVFEGQTLTYREVLQRADFETMTKEELAQAKRLIAGLRLPIPEVRTRWRCR